MGKGSGPKPPDPVKTAAAQTAQNIGTAIGQGVLNNVNQVTPRGTLTYDVTGHEKWKDPNSGKTYKLPQYTATTSLNETGQRIQGYQDEADTNIARIGAEQSGRIGDLLGTPVDLSNEAVEGRLMELGRARLDPALDRRTESLRTRLSQQGIKEGSEAFDRAMMRDAEAGNDAYNQLLLTGRGQAVQEALTERNQPINEITALTSGSQVQMPNFVNTQSPTLANVDRAGLEMAAYDAEKQNWLQKQRFQSDIMGGLFGLASGGLAGGYI